MHICMYINLETGPFFKFIKVKFDRQRKRKCGRRQTNERKKRSPRWVFARKQWHRIKIWVPHANENFAWYSKAIKPAFIHRKVSLHTRSKIIVRIICILLPKTKRLFTGPEHNHAPSLMEIRRLVETWKTYFSMRIVKVVQQCKCVQMRNKSNSSIFNWFNLISIFNSYFSWGDKEYNLIFWCASWIIVVIIICIWILSHLAFSILVY